MQPNPSYSTPNILQFVSYLPWSSCLTVLYLSECFYITRQTQIYKALVEYFCTYISTLYLLMLFLNSFNIVFSKRFINTTKPQDKKGNFL